MPPSATELRCHLHLHGLLNGDVAEVLCHQCSRVTGTHVVHRWNVRTVNQGITESTQQLKRSLGST